jgi:hypothetical protein
MNSNLALLTVGGACSTIKSASDVGKAPTGEQVIACTLKERTS